jgi:hypothetical protein
VKYDKSTTKNKLKLILIGNQFDVQLKLKANVEHLESDKYESYINDLISAFGAKQIDNLRTYLTILCHLDYKLTSAMQKVK